MPGENRIEDAGLHYDAFGRMRAWWIIHLRERRASVMARDVLAIIACFADKKTGRAWPTVETIASVLDVSPKAVKAATRELRELGLILVVRRNRRARESNLYFLAVDGAPFQVTDPVTYSADEIPWATDPSSSETYDENAPF
jgi:hypothetical protein